MLKHEVATQTLYRENPLTAGHPVNGTQVTILALETDGDCLIGDSPVKWDEAARQDQYKYEKGFTHYEHHRYSQEEALEILRGKVANLIADGYVFEVVPDMERFIQTGEWVVEVHQHRKG